VQHLERHVRAVLSKAHLVQQQDGQRIRRVLLMAFLVKKEMQNTNRLFKEV
jgi:hypothetical protein